MQIKFVQANLVLITLLLFLNVELHITACNSYGSENKKTLKLGYRIDAPPFSYCSNFKEKNCKEGEELGYSVDICRHIAENAVKTNLYDDYKFIPVTAVNRFDALSKNEKKIDVLCGATTVTLKRICNFRNTLWTFLSGASLMHHAGLGELTDEDLNKRKIGVLDGTTTIIKLKNYQNVENIRLKPVKSHFEGLNLFVNKDIDIYYADREILFALREKAKSRGVHGVVNRSYFTNEPYALFIRDDEKELLTIANYTLLKLFETGKIQKIFFKNFKGKIMSQSLKNLFKLQQIIVDEEIQIFFNKIVK